MFEITLHTLDEKRNGIIAFSVFILLFGVTMSAGYESIGTQIDLDELLEDYPDFILDLFGKSVGSIGEFGGFYTLEYVQWVWFLIIPVYIGLFCSGFIAGEVENKTADTLLSYPVTRRKVIIEKYVAVLCVIGIINLMGVIATYIGITAYGIDYQIKWMGITMIQATPFLLVWAALFTLLSAMVADSKKASTYAIVMVFFAYFIEVLSGLFGPAKIFAKISPMHYFDPGLVMSKNIVSWEGMAVLIVACALLLAMATYVFEKKDIL